MNNLLFGIFSGISAWFLTGLDDFLVVLTFMKLKTGKLNSLFVTTGTIIGVAIMITICVAVDYFSESTIDKFSNVRYFGIAPLIFGIRGIYKWTRHTDDNSPKNKWIEGGKIGIGSLITYLANSTDDIIVNASIMQNTTFKFLNICWIGFVAGIFIGAFITCFIAYTLLKFGERVQSIFCESKILCNASSYLQLIVNIAIMAVGIIILTDLLPY